MNCRPLIWLWGLLPLMVLWLIAIVVGVPNMERDLAGKAAAALSGAGQEWATVTLDGRDLTLSGAAPDETARQRAHTEMSAVFGIGSVSDRTTIAAAATPKPAPTPTPAPSSPPPVEATDDRAPGAAAPDETD